MNFTSELQPLDLGIIQNFKFHYRRFVLCHTIARATGEVSASEISNTLNVLQGINWKESAQWKVEVATIGKRFHSARFSSKLPEGTTDEGRDPFANLNDNFHSLIAQIAPNGTVAPQMHIRQSVHLTLF